MTAYNDTVIYAPKDHPMPKRQSVNFPGFAHSNPIPNASRIGNLMMSSVISGVDPGTRNYPPTLAGQVGKIFVHSRRAIEAAGGTQDNIIKITFYVQDQAAGRAALNAEWKKMFPDPASRRIPSIDTVPPDANSSPVISLSSEVLPAPLGPTTNRNSPFLSSMFTLRRSSEFG